MNRNSNINFIILLVILYSILALFWPLYDFLSPIAVVVNMLFAISSISFLSLCKFNNCRYVKLLVLLSISYSLLLLLITTPSLRALIEAVKSKYILFPYLCIVFSLVQYDISVLKSLKRISIISILLYVCFIFYFKDFLIGRYNLTYLENTISLDEIVKDFCYSSGFLLLLSPCLKKRYSLSIIFIYIVSIFIAMLLARRNVIVTSLLFLIGTIISYISFYKYNFKYKFLIVGLLLFVFVNLFPEIKALLNGESDIAIFATLNDRVMADSRSDVIEEFKKSMSFLNWIFGKGFAASYFSSALGMRNLIETGYLNIIFRVGIVSLLLYVLILTKAVRIKTDNIVILASKMYIVISIIECLYAGVPTFNLRWIMIWICVSFCFNPNIRSLSNQQIKQLLCA